MEAEQLIKLIDRVESIRITVRLRPPSNPKQPAKALERPVIETDGVTLAEVIPLRGRR